MNIYQSFVCIAENKTGFFEHFRFKNVILMH